MSFEMKSSVRLYRVILLDRTTSPRVNRYIRDLTGLNTWQASVIMNTVPSVVIEDIPLHRAIDVKSQLGRFGLNTKVEVQEELQEDKTSTFIPSNTEITTKNEPRPGKADAISAPATAIPAPKEEKLEPLPPSRLTKRTRRRIPVLTIILPFFLILVLVIIIIFLGRVKGVITITPDGKIVIYQESSKPLTHQKIRNQRYPAQGSKGAFSTPTEETKTLIEKSPSYEPAILNPPQESARVGEGGMVDEKSGGLPQETTQRPPITPEAQSVQADKMPPRITSVNKNPNLAESGSGISPNANWNEFPQNVSPIKATFGFPAMNLPLSGERGKEGLEVNSSNFSPPTRKSYEFIGSPVGEGITDEKLEAIMLDGKEALALEDSGLVAQDYQRLKLASLLAEPQQKDLTENLASPEFQQLLHQMEKVKKRYDLKPGIDFYPEFTGGTLQIHSNLPEETILGVELHIPDQNKSLKYEFPLKNGRLTLNQPGGFPMGIIVLRVYLAPLEENPLSVLETIGFDGEFMGGPFYQGEGELEYAAYLDHKVEPSQKVVSPLEAETEIQNLGLGQGMPEFKTSGFSDSSLLKKPFITISADGVEEGDFILKACRSMGLLTMWMDNPPLYLRLVVNQHQYFISTVVCRRLLGEYGENDLYGFQYLLNHLLAL